jgi:predicted Rossmann fold nucleotide-binding protein DprA/Smf involved in DNA uptake
VLIASGAAQVCLGPDDVARAIGLTSRSVASASDPLLDALAGGPLDLDALARRLGLERAALRPRLVSLVLSGAIVDQGDGRFARGAS